MYGREHHVYYKEKTRHLKYLNEINHLDESITVYYDALSETKSFENKHQNCVSTFKTANKTVLFSKLLIHAQSSK